jgi:hypothetical protein
MRAFATACVLAVMCLGCEETDEDRIDAFVAAVTGELTDERVEHVMKTYVDLAEEPIDVRAFGDGRLYRAEDRERFRQDAARRLGPLMGRSLNAVRKRIDLRGSEATVELQLLSRTMVGQVRYELVKRDKRWLIGTVYVTR